MSYEIRDAIGIDQGRTGGNPESAMMSAGTLVGDDVYNQKGEDLGDIKEIMLDMRSGRVAYAVRIVSINQLFGGRQSLLIGAGTCGRRSLRLANCL